jgi:hypothetical protein
MNINPAEIQAQVASLAKNERLEISKTTTESKPPYIVIGNGNTNKTFKEDVVMDALAVFATLSPNQQQIVMLLRDEMVRNQINAVQKKIQLPNPNEIHLSHTVTDEVAKNVKKRLSENRNSKALKEKKVMRKIRNNIYMLSPYMFIPAYKLAETAQIWHSLEKPDKTSAPIQSEAE